MNRPPVTPAFPGEVGAVAWWMWLQRGWITVPFSPVMLPHPRAKVRSTSAVAFRVLPTVLAGISFAVCYFSIGKTEWGDTLFSALAVTAALLGCYAGFDAFMVVPNMVRNRLAVHAWYAPYLTKPVRGRRMRLTRAGVYVRAGVGPREALQMEHDPGPGGRPTLAALATLTALNRPSA